MKAFLLLLYCAEILSAQLCAAEATVEEPADEPKTFTNPPTTTKDARMGSNQEPETSTYISSPLTSQPSAPTLTTTVASTITTSASSAPFGFLLRDECHLVTMVAGGLVLVCALLLLCTLMLTCKVCQMSRRLRMMNSNTDLFGNSENWTVTAKKDKSQPESAMLMSDIGQTREDLGNGTTKEAGGKGNEAEQRAEENKKEVGGTVSGGEASTDESKTLTPAAAAENPSTSQPQEDATNSPSGAGAASSSEGTEEPKDVV